MSDQVADMSEHSEGGLLLETFIGRYVLDSDARAVWRLIDGTRTVTQIHEDLAASSGLSEEEVRAPVLALCEKLLDLRLVEYLR
ncbi:PqqD family protein [Streptomyces sp. NPDC059917]|uniref:PqqD family protein n=1 Tax=Streptomyces sp. NPDC059917 TaxID=3347002 RepID=UPI00364D591E